jgi:hypothetical protein
MNHVAVTRKLSCLCRVFVRRFTRDIGVQGTKPPATAGDAGRSASNNNQKQIMNFRKLGSAQHLSTSAPPRYDEPAKR